MTQQPTEGDIKQALIEARREAIDASRVEEQPERHRRVRVLRFLLVLSLLFGGYALGTRPAWLITPPPPPEPPAISEASLRVAMWQLAVHVERYRAEHHRLPRTLAEAEAPTVEGVEYQPTGPDEYLLTGHNGDLELTLDSRESLDAFLGQSLSTITTRGAQ